MNDFKEYAALTFVEKNKEETVNLFEEFIGSEKTTNLQRCQNMNELEEYF